MVDKAVLVLEDGKTFEGTHFGARTKMGGEVVFNTAMSGYQEVLGDPSYAKQIVVMTYPMMGNYGIAPEDHESKRSFLTGLVVKETSGIASNWRHDRTLEAFLEEQGVPGIAGIDTRALVRHLRDKGAMRGMIAHIPKDASSKNAPYAELLEEVRALPAMGGCDLASEVTCTKPYVWDAPSLSWARTAADKDVGTWAKGLSVVVMDFGVKWNILRNLVDMGAKVTVVPAKTSAEEILAMKPDGVLLSNGPGDPKPVAYAIETIKALIGKLPLFGICLGHQLLCLALGAESFKLKFGHHGANHPIQDLKTRRVAITSQNHGFAIDPESISDDVAEMTHINLNDKTLAGIALRKAPAFSVQYHPESAPGPHDAGYLFGRFAEMMQKHRSA